jgi:hypothetical protein
MKRRGFMIASGASIASYLLGDKSAFSQEQGSSDFQTIFSEIQGDPEAVESAFAFRDFAMADNGAACIPVTLDGTTTCIVSAARQPPRILPSDLSISEDSKKLMVFYEVTSKANYEKKLRAPIWPGQQSGVTIGIGYDLGYASKDDLQREWSEYIHPFTLNKLASVCGKKGANAQNALDSVKNVRIEWDSAYPQFTDVLLPVFVALTETYCDNLDDLHEDCRGALTSLIFNRGTALQLKNDPVDSRREMREIKTMMAQKNYKDIPAKLIEMQRLWRDKPKARGVVNRRAAEAALFQRGLDA